MCQSAPIQPLLMMSATIKTRERTITPTVSGNVSPRERSEAAAVHAEMQILDVVSMKVARRHMLSLENCLSYLAMEPHPM